MIAACGERCRRATSPRVECTCSCRGWNHGLMWLVEARRRALEPEEFAAWLEGVNDGRRSPSAPAAVGGVLL